MATEKRLIDANVLICAIDQHMLGAYDCPLSDVADFQRASNNTKTIYAVEGLYEATEIIDDQPTVDAVEVVRKPVYGYEGYYEVDQFGRVYGVDRTVTVTDNGRAKLSEKDVRAIKTKRANGETFQKIADEYGVHKRTVMDAVSGKNWSGITIPEPPKEENK